MNGGSKNNKTKIKTHRLVSILLSLSFSFAFIAENLCVEEFEL
jgi:hypothetical protein